MHHDAPIPAPALWGKTTAQKLTEADLDQTIAERRAFIPQGCDQQGRLVPTIPAESCTELGADADDAWESADREVLGYLWRTALGASVLLVAGPYVWRAGTALGLFILELL